MKSSNKLILAAGLLAPLAASAQFVSVAPGSPEMPGQLLPSGFHQTTTAMNADVFALGDGFHNSGAGPEDFDSNPLHLSLENEFYWDGTNFSAGDPGGAQKFEFVTPNFTHFVMSGDFSIGYIGNESNDDNELYMTADLDTAPGGEQWVLSTINDNGALFDYDGADPNSDDDAPMSYGFNKESDYANDDLFLQFVHYNRTQTSMGTQGSFDRFKIFAEIENDEFTGHYIMAVADRNSNFDGDRDDGFFYLQGDITPVPEPSQLAALALVGLGGFLYIRRRIRSAKK